MDTGGTGGAVGSGLADTPAVGGRQEPALRYVLLRILRNLEERAGRRPSEEEIIRWIFREVSRDPP
jgi:hypothetical protein